MFCFIGLVLFVRLPISYYHFFFRCFPNAYAQRWLYESRVLPACGGKGERSIMSSCRNVIMSSCHHAVKDFGIGVSERSIMP